MSDSATTGRPRLPRWLIIIAPGILVAATGVGAGDLATAAFTGAQLKLAVLWAVLVGAGLKYVLNEGIARWQLVTGTTFIEGCVEHFGKWVQYGFLAYLAVWSFFVGSALMSACGATLHAILPWQSAEQDKLIYGIGHSLIAVVLVFRGGFRLFERVMSVCIAIMFVTVVATAIAIGPSPTEFLQGLLIPRIPRLDPAGTGLIDPDALAWTVALMGGVGGTLTILCYGYWIREVGRTDASQIRICRIDLATGYGMTALFGVGMVILGSQIQADAKGAALLVQLSDQLGRQLGSNARWAFLLGAWGAVFSSLLGVWQAMPYLFADFWRMTHPGSQDSESRHERLPAYRFYLLALATVPTIGLMFDFREVQKIYAIVGALCIPLLAVGVLTLAGSARHLGRHRNSLMTNITLGGCLGVSLILVVYQIQKLLAAA